MLEYKWYCEGEPSSCTESICGDHRVTAGEECDDRWSPANGDGCTANCIIEAGWTCKAQNDTGTSVCAEQCGDGIVTVHEQCDDANSAPGDGCYHCAFETGWYCEGSPSVCENVVCGDGDVSPIEGCDDNNTVSHDGCTACTVDLGYKCTGSPSVCSWITCDLKQTGLTVNNCSCNSVPDGSVIIVATGGTGNLSYAVRRASSVFDPSKLNFTSNNRIAPLQAGDYVALVKDASNCYINGSSFTVVEPPGIIVVYQKCVNVTCYSYADGAVDYYAYRDNSTTEEQLQLRYAITGGANITFVSDPHWNGLTPGSYMVLVQDGKCIYRTTTCRVWEPASIMIIVTEVSHASVSSDTSSVVHKIDDGSVMQNGSASSYSSNVCGETAISVEVTGGFPPYTTYVDGAVLPESASGEVPAGHHEVKVRDSHECYSNSADVNVPYCEPKHVREGLRLWKAYGVWAVLATSVCVGIVAVVATAAVVFQLVRLRRKSSRSGILLETMSKFI
eukprot:TRINITY_DN315_c0_g2_i11.p1 TRINITY_DN315_c0_g2~~TRINITY_DN315_c0_g2_i11.p1  ORF type:complete len:503 (-),score=81.96 TRINITY_DN315_c0_g2_i11:146-1654(-)